MAYTKIINIKTRLDRAVKYILNPDKTKDGLYIGGCNCSPSNAIHQMNDTKARYNKNGGRLGGHIIQSFEQGEVTPEVAFDIANEYASKYLGDRYEVVFSTHVDRGHIHNHIIWNTVSFVDGYKYQCDVWEYKKNIRGISDNICKNRGLSVIEVKGKNESNMHYAEWQAVQAGKTTWRDILRADIDSSIDNAPSLYYFLMEMEKRGYEYKDGKYLSFRCKGMDRFIRLKSLGKGYRTRMSIAD